MHLCKRFRVCVRQGPAPAPLAGAPGGVRVYGTPRRTIYHLSVKTISRSAGRSATAAAAYRAGVAITDERSGEVHD